MSLQTRRASVAISVEAILQQWARQEAGPAGAAVIVDTEISARSRGGVEWRVDRAVGVGVLARPAALDPTDTDIAWLAAGLGARAALGDRFGADLGATCWWPDHIDLAVDSGLQIGITAACALGPGTVDFVVLTVRVGPVPQDSQRLALAEALVEHLREVAGDLDRPDAIAARYRDHCSTVGHDVEVARLPHGIVRGRADDIDDAGRLVLVSPTGLRQPLAVNEVSTVTRH